MNLFLMSSSFMLGIEGLPHEDSVLFRSSVAAYKPFACKGLNMWSDPTAHVQVSSGDTRGSYCAGANDNVRSAAQCGSIFIASLDMEICSTCKSGTPV
jgi:hypothetical protein